MTRMIRTLVMLTTALATAAPIAAQQALPRSASGGPGDGGKGPAAVAVPRHPYAGNWDGTLSVDGANAPVKIAMALTVADAERQAYNGQTTIDGRTAQTHLNISSAPASDSAKATDAPIARRSPGGGDTAPAPLAEGPAPERDTLAAGDHALLLFHTPTKSMLLCDEGHRCVTLASLSWQETGADGTRYAYTAKMVSADTINGTVTITKGDKTQNGTFTLGRTK